MSCSSLGGRRRGDGWSGWFSVNISHWCWHNHHLHDRRRLVDGSFLELLQLLCSHQNLLKEELKVEKTEEGTQHNLTWFFFVLFFNRIHYRVLCQWNCEVPGGFHQQGESGFQRSIVGGLLPLSPRLPVLHSECKFDLKWNHLQTSLRPLTYSWVGCTGNDLKVCWFTYYLLLLLWWKYVQYVYF